MNFLSSTVEAKAASFSRITIAFDYGFHLSTLLVHYWDSDSQRLKITLRIVRNVIFPGATMLFPTSSPEEYTGRRADPG